jgi:hypothetical protein
VRHAIGRCAKRPDEALNLCKGLVDRGREPIIFVATGGDRHAFQHRSRKEALTDVGDLLDERQPTPAIPPAEQEAERAGGNQCP